MRGGLAVSMIELLLVTGRVLASSGTNALQKHLTIRDLHPLLIVAATLVLLSVYLLPVLYFIPLATLPVAFWWSITAAALLDTPGNIILVTSVGLTDLSLIGPLNAYKPVVGVILGVLLLGEIPTGLGLIGVAIIVAGSLLLAPTGHGAGWQAVRALARDRGVQFRMLSLVMTAAAAVFMKQAINVSSSMQTFMAWTFLSAPIAVIGFLILARSSTSATVKRLRASGWKLGALAILFLLMQGFTLQVFAIMHVGYALALFQLSALVNVVFGRTLFDEGDTLKRAAAAGIMVIGAALLINAS